MRIASGGIQHETNTFSATPTLLADFIRDSQCDELSGGDVIRRRYQNTNCIHGGYLDGADAQGLTLLPLMTAKSQPSGVVKQEAFDHMLQLFLRRLREVSSVDGVLLDLHGAMVTEQHQDAESAFAAAVRKQVGPKLPIVTTLDLHANISPALVEHVDVVIGFDTYPHVDMNERGREAVRLLAGMVRGEVRPATAYRQLPLLTMPPMQCTLRQPMSSVLEYLHEIESRPGILTATISMGFPFADIHDAGVSVLVTSDDDQQLADRMADELADHLWSLRDKLQPKLTTIEEAMRFAAGREAGELTVFADGSDNPGGGAPCDGTVALQALLDAEFQNAAVGVLCDPETVRQAERAGVGATVEVTLGGKTDRHHGKPVRASAVVQSLCDGQFVYRGPMLHGVQDSMGASARLRIGGTEIVVSSRRRQCLDAEMLRVAGVEPRDKRLVVVKSAVHFRADFADLAVQIFDADTPGIHRPDFSAYEYRRLRRPIYPLDQIDHR